MTVVERVSAATWNCAKAAWAAYVEMRKRGGNFRKRVLVPALKALKSGAIATRDAIYAPAKWFWEHVLVPAATRTRHGAAWTSRQLLNGALTAGRWARDNVVIPVARGVRAVYRGLARAVHAASSFLFAKVLQPIGNGVLWLFRSTVWAVKTTANFLFTRVLAPSGRGVLSVSKLVAAAVKTTGAFTYKHVLSPVATTSRDFVFRPSVKIVSASIRAVVVTGNFLYTAVLRPVGRAIEASARAAIRLLLFLADMLYTRVLVPVAFGIRSAVLIGSHALTLYVLQPMLSLVRVVAHAVMDMLRMASKFMGELASAMGHVVRMLAHVVGDLFRAIADMFRAIGKKVGG